MRFQMSTIMGVDDEDRMLGFLTRCRTSSTEDCPELVRFRHDLRQYVAAGELLLDLPEGESDAGDAVRAMNGLRHVFSALSDLASQAGTHADAGWTFDVAQLVCECVFALGLDDDARLDLVTTSPTAA